MKTFRYPKMILLLLLALGLSVGSLIRAQETPPESTAAPTAPTAPAAPAEPEQAAEPAADTQPVPVAAPEENEEGMRELASTEKDETVVEKKDDAESEHHSHGRRWQNNEVFSIGSDNSLEAGEEAEVIITILGSSQTAGEVRDAVVTIMGGSRVTGGKVGDAVVTVLGSTYINGHVKKGVVTVLGNVELGPQAVVEGELVCIGGKLTRAEGAVVRGQIQNIGIAGRSFDFTGLTTWISECLVYGRPLAFNRHLVWAWTIALGMLGFYALIALITPGAVVKCAETLEQRPGYSLLTALLTLLLTPVAYILLALLITLVIGIVLIPVFSLGLFFAAIFGKIVMLAWVGRRFTKLLGDGPLSHPVFGVLIGGIIVLGLYTIPIVGFVVYKLLGILGLGVVVYTLILQFKASRPPKPVKPVAPSPSAVGGMASMGATAGVAGTEASGMEPPPVVPLHSAAPPVISAATLPRVGFWLRLGASVLDAILVGIVCGMVSSFWHRFGSAYLLWFVAYCVVMWTTKGTTIGGIICGLKVVRLDDRPLDWGAAIVRALGGFLSFVVAGLGFIWVAFDDEKQSWHDKIAGTTVVKVPKGTPLL